MADAEYFKLDDGTVLAVADAAARQKVGSAELQTTAKDCSGAINELKQSLDLLGPVKSKIAYNVNSFTVTLDTEPSSSHGGVGLLINANVTDVAMFRLGEIPLITSIFGSKAHTITRNGTTFTVSLNDSGILWGTSMILWTEN